MVPDVPDRGHGTRRRLGPAIVIVTLLAAPLVPQFLYSYEDVPHPLAPGSTIRLWSFTGVHPGVIALMVLSVGLVVGVVLTRGCPPATRRTLGWSLVVMSFPYHYPAVLTASAFRRTGICTFTGMEVSMCLDGFEISFGLLIAPTMVGLGGVWLILAARRTSRSARRWWRDVRRRTARRSRTHPASRA